MEMFCYQCQEALQNTGCTARGVCGKDADTANLQDLLIYVLKGISLAELERAGNGDVDSAAGKFINNALFATITNANFDAAKLTELVRSARDLRDRIASGLSAVPQHDSVTWSADTKEEFLRKAVSVGVRSTENEDVRSLRELLVYGLKGIAAYASHAEVLGYENNEIYSFVMEALASTTRDLSVDDMIAMVLRAGEAAVKTMALLDEANTAKYGHPEATTVNIGVRGNPGILISGHDLKDMEELLQQTEGTGVDVYTHSEMLPAHYYPAFKKFSHFAGNYGSAWWKQGEEFASFNGP
ncbi:MAG TPA: hydroxylamine reductase, partial [Spirochaetota bacterium]|nr:hydroxylamine reductase [Spirochaetota bacterium]